MRRESLSEAKFRVEAGFIEQIRQALGQPGLGDPVAGHDAELALHLSLVITQRAVPAVAHDAAGFAKDDIRRTDVPFFGSARWMKVEINLPARQQANLEPQTADN